MIMMKMPAITTTTKTTVDTAVEKIAEDGRALESVEIEGNTTRDLRHWRRFRPRPPETTRTTTLLEDQTTGKEKDLEEAEVGAIVPNTKTIVTRTSIQEIPSPIHGRIITIATIINNTTTIETTYITGQYGTNPAPV